jgi:replicative DNA helicase
MDLGISMLAIHSLNKMGMDKRNGKPGMAQLRGSGQIGYDADMILMLTEYDENYERLLLTKQELENIKMLFFDKGRTLIGKNGCVLVKHPTLPIFNEYTPDFERIER